MTTTEITLPPHLSYSQVSTMQRCGQQWFLERGLGLAGRPSWATTGGSAVHDATETWDRWTLAGEWEKDPAKIAKLFNDSFDKAIADQEERSPLFPKSEWRASGRASKQWPEKENEAWWRENGPTMVMRWATWRLNNPSWELAEAVEEGGIEIPFRTTIGGVMVRGYIDRLFHRNETELLVLDLKSGSHMPDDGSQLGTYKLGLEEQHGVTPTWGTFWNARTGSTTDFEDLSLWPKARLDYLFGSTRKMQEEGIFIAKVSPMCSGCSVRRFCPAVNGEESDLVPLPWQISVVKPESISAA